MTFTTDQQKAIDHAGSALLVSAAAGSGKTAVLVERAIKTICDPAANVPADGLLIVTFTKAAAASLRAKLAKRLRKEIQKTPNSYLRKQLLLLQRAPICTIDSYCLQLVQTHFSALDIPPDFETADDAQLADLREKSLAAAMEQAYQDPDFCRFADLYGKGRSDATAAEMVLSLNRLLSSLPNPDETLEQFCAQWRSDVPLPQTVWGKALLAEAEHTLAAAQQLTNANIAVVNDDGELDAYLPALRDDLDRIHALQALAQQGAWDELMAKVPEKWARLGTVKNYCGKNLQLVQDRRKLVKKIIKNMFEKVLVCTLDEFEQDRQRTLPLVEALVRATANFRATFLQAKLDEKVLEFGDVEQYALQLLQQNGNPTPLAAQISQKLFAVMVDEYQDTNALQDALYHALAGQNAEKLFLVGDLKQSIYRFRQADPSIFQQKLQTFALSDTAAPGEKSKVFLDKNFRSAPGVIAGINSLFASLMSAELGGVDYGEGERLVPGFGDVSGYGGYAGGCELHVVQAQTTRTNPKAPAHADDAPFVAQRIAALMAQENGFVVRDGETTRPPRYEDFCILLRSRSGAECYAAALEAQGVPVHIDRAENLLNTPEVSPMVSLLRVLDNPAQDEHLAAVMLNLGGFVPDDLVRLRVAQPKGSFYGAVRADETEKTKDFLEKLATLRQLSQTIAVDRLMEEILLRTGWLAAVGAMPEGEMRRDNLRSFVAFVSANGKRGLAGVVRSMDAALASGKTQSGGGATSRSGAVSIMTIHRSKGLEFPVVLLPGLSRGFNKTDMRAATVFDAKLGIGLKLRRGQGDLYATAAYSAIVASQTVDSISEEMRVLYVAATRAQDKLIVSAAVKSPENKLASLSVYRTGKTALSPNLLKNCQSFGDWVLVSALGHPKGQALQNQLAMQPLLDDVAMPETMQISLEEPLPPEETLPARQGLPTAAVDPAAVEQITQRIGWQYPKRSLTHVPAKVSVTALAHSNEELILQRPAFLYKEGLTAAEKGTALHAFLQYANFEAAKADPKAEAKRQVAQKLLLPALYEKMDFSKLNQFFESPLYTRIAAAQQQYRELAFITAVPAATVMGDEGDYGDAHTLVQGVADLLLEFDTGMEIVDYKTDKGKTEQEFIRSYQTQLFMYAAALQKRFAKPIDKLTIYSFDLGREINVKFPQKGQQNP